MAANDHHGQTDAWASISGDPSSHKFLSQECSIAGIDSHTAAKTKPLLKKAKSYRRRIVPVGPAGVWFQAQEEQPARKRCDNNDDDDDEEERLTQIVPQPTSETPNASFASSPAWTAAHCALGISTPSLPLYWQQEKKRQALKSYIPSNYLLLADIRQGTMDWALHDGLRLLVQVSTIQSVTANDHLWTAVLEDETGDTLSAWIQPELVRQEQQANKWVRVGNVWLLQQCTIHLVPKDDDEGWDRMLLVGESNLCEMWSPSSADAISTKDYIAWMEARNSLTSTLLSGETMDATYKMTEVPAGCGIEEEDEEQEIGDGSDDDKEPVEGDLFANLGAKFNTVVDPQHSSQMNDSTGDRGDVDCGGRRPMASNVFQAHQRKQGDHHSSRSSSHRYGSLSHKPPPSLHTLPTEELQEAAPASTNDIATCITPATRAVVTPTTGPETPPNHHTEEDHHIAPSAGADQRDTSAREPCGQSMKIKQQKRRIKKRRRRAPALYTEAAARYLEHIIDDEEVPEVPQPAAKHSKKSSGLACVDDDDDDEWLETHPSDGSSRLYDPTAFAGFEFDDD